MWMREDRNAQIANHSNRIVRGSVIRTYNFIETSPRNVPERSSNQGRAVVGQDDPDYPPTRRWRGHPCCSIDFSKHAQSVFSCLCCHRPSTRKPVRGSSSARALYPVVRTPTHQQGDHSSDYCPIQGDTLTLHLACDSAHHRALTLPANRTDCPLQPFEIILYHAPSNAVNCIHDIAYTPGNPRAGKAPHLCRVKRNLSDFRYRLVVLSKTRRNAEAHAGPVILTPSASSAPWEITPRSLLPPCLTFPLRPRHVPLAIRGTL